MLRRTADRLICFDRQLCVGVWFVEMGPSLLVDCQSRSHFECLYIFDMAQIHAVGMSTVGSKLRGRLLCISARRLINERQATFCGATENPGVFG